MILLLASALMLAPEALPVMGLDAFQNTNQLVWDRSFKAELARFLASASGRQVGSRRVPEALQPGIRELLGGPPDPVVRTPKGNYLFTACRKHSCPEKGGVVLGRDGRIIALGVISVSDPYSGKTDLSNPGLHIWVDDASKASADATDALTRWASSSLVISAPSGPNIYRFSSSER